MKDTSKTNPELIEEISFLKQKIKELEQSESDLKQAEEELHRTKADLEVVRTNNFDPSGLTTVGYCTVSEQGLIQRFTPTAATMLGASQSTLMKQPITRFILKEDQSIYYRHRKQLFETGEPQACELRMVRMDGTTFWAHLAATTAQDIGGTPEYRVVLSDITERKLAEDNFRILADLNDSSPVSITVHDLQGNFLYANQKTFDLHGYSKDEFFARNLHDIDVPASAHLIEARIQKIMKVGEAQFDVEHYRKDGTSFPLEVFVKKTKWGRKNVLLSIASDITERKQAEAELKQQTDAMEASMDGIAILNEDHNYVYVNEAHARIYGYNTSEELMGTSWRVLYDEDELQRFDSNIMPELIQKAQWQGEATGKKKDGSAFPQEISLTALDNGGLICIVRDINSRKEAEEELRKNEAKLKSIFRAAPVGIGVVSDRMIIDTNDRLCAMTGYKREELVGQNARILYLDEKEYNFVGSEKYRQIAETGTGTVETRWRMKNGKVIHILLSSTPFDLNDLAQGVTFTALDITDRKLAEKGLQESETLQRTLLENLPAGVIIIDPVTRIIENVNNAAAAMFGIQAERIVGHRCHAFLCPASEGACPVCDLGKEVDNSDREMICTDGSRRPVLKSVKRVQIGGQEKLLECFIDITDRKQAEEAITREREKLKSLSDNAPFGMVLIDQGDHFTYINSKFSELFGYDLSDIPDGRTWCRKAYPEAEYRHTVISAWREDLRSNKPGREKPNVFTVTCRDGTQKIIQFIFSALISGDSLMTCEDITELKHIESQLRQSQKMEAIGTMAGGIAHDFNNILTALMGYASLIQMKLDVSNPLRPFIDEVLSASEKAVDLTQSLLAFSRQQSVTLVPLDMNSTIKEAKKLLMRLLTEDIEFRTSLTDVEMIVMADKSQMDQILFNLVTNARDAMLKGGVLTLETGFATIDAPFIKVHGFGEPGEYVRISITDTGTGMDKITRSKIFDPFFTTKEVGKGTGLGLATVYGIVKQNNGYITVESTLNQGTTFHIYLPQVKMKVDEKEELIIPIKRGKETILIAEDNEGVRRFMREALQGQGYTITEAIDGEDAVRKFKERRDIDLIIIDSVMPKKNGRETYEEIHRIDPHIKALFTSGYTKDIVLDKGIMEKEFDFIGKPLSLNKLLQKIREVLDREQTSQMN